MKWQWLVLLLLGCVSTIALRPGVRFGNSGAVGTEVVNRARAYRIRRDLLQPAPL
jgi:hypothetical protein